MSLTPAIIAQALEEQAADAYVVGGYLRDVLLGRASRDIDIAIASDVASVGKRLAGKLDGSFFLLDAERQIGRIALQEEHSVLHYVDLTSYSGDIREDLGRRDFTIDAMALPLTSTAADLRSDLLDAFNGVADLSARSIRAVQDDVFKNDGLRLLRAVRLCAELDFEIDAHTAEVARRDASYLASASAERQRDELMRIMETPRAGQAMYQLDELGLLCLLIPEICIGKEVVQPKEHYYDVFDHNLQTVVALDLILTERPPTTQAALTLWQEVWQSFIWPEDVRTHWRDIVTDGFTRAALLKFAGLLHDVAKPYTKTVEKDGRTRFFGHDHIGAETATDIMHRLRFSGAAIRLVSIMIEEHLRPPQMAQNGLPSRRALYRYYRDAGEAATDVLFLSLADHMAARGPDLDLREWRVHIALMNYICKNQYEEQISRPQRLLTGNDLMKALGLPPGPAIGRLLRAIEEAYAAGEIGTRDDALALARQELVK